MSEIVPHDFLRQEIEVPKVEIVSSATTAIEAARRVIEIVLGERVDFVRLDITAERERRCGHVSLHGRSVMERWVEIGGEYLMGGTMNGPTAPFSGRVLCRQVRDSDDHSHRKLWFMTPGSPLSTFVINGCGYVAMWTYSFDGPLSCIDVFRRRLHDAEEVPLERYEGTGFHDRRVIVGAPD